MTADRNMIMILCQSVIVIQHNDMKEKCIIGKTDTVMDSYFIWKTPGHSSTN